MTTMRARVPATIGSTWLMVLLAPALVVGIVAMHSVLAQPPGESDMAPMAAAAALHVDMHGDVPAGEVSSTVGRSPGGEHGTERGGMSDCGGLMTMCMALLVSVAALLLGRDGGSRWVLWQLPPPSLLRLGHVRDAFQALTPRQRTAVIRC